MSCDNRIQDIKLQIQHIKSEIKDNKNKFKRLSNNIEYKNISSLGYIEMQILKQNILNEIAGEPIGGISEYYYNEYKKSGLDEESLEDILKGIEKLENEKNRLLNLQQQFICESKIYKKENENIKVPKVTRRTK